MKFVKYIIIISFTLTVSTCNCLAYMNYSEKNQNSILEDAECITIIVDEGDTLWNIAKPYYDGDKDFRNLIYSIKKINDLEESLIYPGQKIIIPLL